MFQYLPKNQVYSDITISMMIIHCQVEAKSGGTQKRVAFLLFYRDVF